MKLIILVVYILYTVLLAFCRHVDFFRKDYKYIQEFDAYYKVHLDVGGSSWSNAFLSCEEEGATLFYPKVQDEWTLVKNLTDTMTEVPNVTDIFVGLHDDFKLGELITVDGLPTPYPLLADGRPLRHHDGCVTMNINTGKFSMGSCSRSPAPLPFVCKKVDDIVSCPTIDQDYKLSNTLKKCYKINKRPKTWEEAMKTCFMEGGILAVIKNSDQANEIKFFIDTSETYFVGVKKLLPRDEYFTVTGQKFSFMFQNPYHNQDTYNGPDENGYLPDENGRYPDENGQYPESVSRVISHDSTECGTVSKQSTNSLYTETASCDKHLPFICEMEVDQ